MRTLEVILLFDDIALILSGAEHDFLMLYVAKLVLIEKWLTFKMLCRENILIEYYNGNLQIAQFAQNSHLGIHVCWDPSAHLPLMSLWSPLTVLNFQVSDDVTPSVSHEKACQQVEPFLRSPAQ